MTRRVPSYGSMIGSRPIKASSLPGKSLLRGADLQWGRRDFAHRAALAIP
ncbi:MAG: hypothetical protein ACLP51_12970 [Syntrophobacteraceae bacterium]